jgi:hypothetical protein
MERNYEYTEALYKASVDLANKIQSRDIINAEIAGLRETVRVLSSRVTLNQNEEQHISQILAMAEFATPSLADSIRALLTRIYPKDMTVIEVRNTLEESNFNFDEFSNPLSACHAALKRMYGDKEIEIAGEKNGKPSYRRIIEPLPQPDSYEKLFGVKQNPFSKRTRDIPNKGKA